MPCIREGDARISASGRLLEGCCGQEGFGSQCCLGNTKDDTLAFCRLFTFCGQLLIHFFEIQNIYQSTGQEFGVSVILDTDFLQHLTYQDFDMLIGDIYTL